jgi:hypothetical protein
MVQANFNPPSYIDINSGVQFNSKQVMISAKPVTTNSNTNIFFVGNVFNNKDDFDYIVGFTQQDLSFRWNPRNGFGDNNGNDFSLDSGYIINGGTGTKDFSKRALVNFVVQSGGSGQLTLSTDKNFGGDRFFKGVMCEFIVFNTPLTTSQIQEIQGYLAWKWGVNSNLPSNHPYFSSAPPGTPSYGAPTSVVAPAPIVYSGSPLSYVQGGDVQTYNNNQQIVVLNDDKFPQSPAGVGYIITGPSVQPDTVVTGYRFDLSNPSSRHRVIFMDLSKPVKGVDATVYYTPGASPPPPPQHNFIPQQSAPPPPVYQQQQPVQQIPPPVYQEQPVQQSQPQQEQGKFSFFS